MESLSVARDAVKAFIYRTECRITSTSRTTSGTSYKPTSHVLTANTHNMHNDTLFVGEEAREKIASGIKKAALAVGSTMGTGGSNGIIEAIENPGYLLTNDGWSLLNSMKFADPIEEIGRKMLVEAVSRANKQSGDGSSTTTVLTNAIIEEGKGFLKETSPMELKRSLEACVPLNRDA